jgi:pilus assembly protein CpaF
MLKPLPGIANFGIRDLTDAEISQAVARAADMLKDVSLEDLNDPERLSQRSSEAAQSAIQQLGMRVSPETMSRIISQVEARLGGMGFLHDFLPPQRTDLNEIAVTPDGKVWILPKGERNFVAAGVSPTQDEVLRTVLALLAPIRRAVDEATPSVDAKLPRMEGTGGARVKVLHPCIVPGKGYYSINVRLFEPNPVTIDQLVRWKMAPENVLRELARFIGERKARAMISGGTATGKTTLLSALCEGIPFDERIVKIEDPEEIFLPHPHVVTIEARPAPPGSKVKPYEVKDGVDDAMRMTPQRLIVGEVRKGDAAMSLFRAMMSDHPGITTFHSESPEDAVYRLSVIMFTDLQVRMEAAKAIFAQAIDIVMQIGWQDDKRVLLGVWEVGKQLQSGDVHFKPLYTIGESSVRPMTRR